MPWRALEASAKNVSMAERADTGIELGYPNSGKLVGYFGSILAVCSAGLMMWGLFSEDGRPSALKLILFGPVLILSIWAIWLFPAFFAGKVILKEGRIQKKFLGRIWKEISLDREAKFQKCKLQFEFENPTEYAWVTSNGLNIGIEQSIKDYRVICERISEAILSDIRKAATGCWSDPIERDVKAQIKLRSGRPVLAIKSESEIYGDFGIYGVDLCEIVDSLKRTYGTQFNSFSVHEYGPPESAVLVPYWRKLGRYRNYKPLTVGHLIEVVRRGAWFEGPQPAFSDRHAAS